MNAPLWPVIHKIEPICHRKHEVLASPGDPELLASLDPSEDDEETDAVVDGWGKLRGSTFVILQYGPRHGARYKFKYRNGYTNDNMNDISRTRVADFPDQS